MEYTVNCSIVLAHLPLLERAAAARAAGFRSVEFWWPFDAAVPRHSEVDAFVRSIQDAGVELAALNFAAGDMRAGDRGLVSSLVRGDQFRENVAVVVDIGERLGCGLFNALYGNREPRCSAEEQDAEATRNLSFAAAAVTSIGGTVLLEPLSGTAAYPLRTAADVLRVIDRVHGASGAQNIKLLADFYHMAVNGEDVGAVVAEHGADLGHVQLADAPGRGEPGTGTLPLDDWVAQAIDAGYRGRVALEYAPTTPDPFAWLSASRRG